MAKTAKSTEKGPKLQEFQLAELNPAEYNPHAITDDALAGLTKSLERFGCVEPIVVNIRGGRNRIVGGHSRCKGLLALGVTRAVCVTVDLSDAEEKLLNVTLNNPRIQGQFTDALGVMIAKLRASLPDESALLDLRIRELAADLPDPPREGRTGDDEIPEPPKKAITKPGDLWILGDHRLLCGDSTKKDLVGRCLQAERPRLMVTDPPYGVQYRPNWRNDAGVSSSTKVATVANDNRASWSETFNLFSPSAIYVWHGALHAAEVERSLTACGFELRAQIIWVKRRFVLSRGHYHWRHEPCFYAVRKNGGGGQWRGGRKQSTVWADIIDHFAEMPELLVCPVDAETLYAFEAGRTTVWEIPYDKGVGSDHATQKPVECMARPMQHNSSEGDTVSDPFLGTGSTIIAAEKLGRKCYGLEIDPVYCDVIVERWQAWTGKKAKRVKG